MSKARNLSVVPNQTLGMKNRIINGAMVIDQRNAGASVSLSNGTTTYITDRWGVYESTSGAFTAQQVADAPSGFTYSLKVTTSTAATPGANELSVARQAIEGYNVADLNWGTSNAKTITLSFWAKSSLTGQFGGSLFNVDVNRSYPFTYTISVANTWEQKSITITGDTTGTWNTTNGAGIYVNFDLGTNADRLGTANAWAAADYRGATGDVKLISTLNATWQITGVQLEVGTQATTFDYRSYGTELAMCQRYAALINYGSGELIGSGFTWTTTNFWCAVRVPQPMRVTATLIATSGTNYYLAYGNSSNQSYNNSLSYAFNSTTAGGNNLSYLVYGPSGWSSSWAANLPIMIVTNSSSSSLLFDAEL